MQLFHVEQLCAGNMGIFAHDCFWGDAIVPRGTILRGGDHGVRNYKLNPGKVMGRDAHVT